MSQNQRLDAKATGTTTYGAELHLLQVHLPKGSSGMLDVVVKVEYGSDVAFSHFPCSVSRGATGPAVVSHTGGTGASSSTELDSEVIVEGAPEGYVDVYVNGPSGAIVSAWAYGATNG